MPLSVNQHAGMWSADRKSTRLNSSHTVIYTLSLHDALPICVRRDLRGAMLPGELAIASGGPHALVGEPARGHVVRRSEEHTSELQSHRDLHSFPTRRSSDLRKARPARGHAAR